MVSWPLMRGQLNDWLDAAKSSLEAYIQTVLRVNSLVLRNAFINLGIECDYTAALAARQ